MTSPGRIGGDLSLDENRFKTILISNQDYNDKLGQRYSIIEYLQSENSNGDTVENHENLYYLIRKYIKSLLSIILALIVEHVIPEMPLNHCTKDNNLCIDNSDNVNYHQHKEEVIH